MTGEGKAHDPFSEGARALRLAIVALGVGVVVLLAGMVAMVLSYRSSQEQARDRRTAAAEARNELCNYSNRISAGAKLDRQFLVVLSSRPGLPPDPARDQIIKAYLDFGDKAYPQLDCADVRAGRKPPDLPPLPPSPLASATSTTVP